jgi:outer membrane protein assembly factor BamD
MKKIHFIILSLLIAALSACSSKVPDVAEIYRGQSENKIFNDGQTEMLKKNYSEAISRFEAINALYPFGEHYRQAQLNLMYCYYQHDDLPLALAATDRYMSLYPRGPDIDYVYYLRGVIKFDENHGSIEQYFNVDFAKRDTASLEESYESFERLVQLYPHSSYADDAQQRMIFIYNALARRELFVANFYFDRAAYVAAINRATTIITTYPRSDSTEQALILTVKAYRKLKLNQEEDDYLKVLKLNFPKTEVK